MPETFRGFQLAGKLFLLTSLFIEPNRILPTGRAPAIRSDRLGEDALLIGA